MLCAFFKAGSCSKGDKCKFSHDLNVARKGEKKNIYENKESSGKVDEYMESSFFSGEMSLKIAKQK